MLGIQNEREWLSFCHTGLLRPELATDSRFTNNSLRTQNCDQLKAIIDDIFSTMTRSEVVESLERASIANASINDMKGVWDHPQLDARQRWIRVKTSKGAIPAPLPPGLRESKDARFDARMDAVPDVGEHNNRILSELGMPRDQ